jgi:hypothetical protein
LLDGPRLTAMPSRLLRSPDSDRVERDARSVAMREKGS